MEIKKDINYSPNIESAVLGLCTLVAGSYGRVYGVLEKNYFYSTGNQIVFETMSEMFKNGIPIDLFTVIDQIKRVKCIYELDGYPVDYFVSRLQNHVVSDTHLEYHCHIIKTLWMEREIINLTHGGLGKLEGAVPQQVKAIQDRLHSLQTKSGRT